MPLACAHAQKVATASDIGVAIGACIAATGPAGVDEARLGEAGFARGEIEAKGKTIETGLGFFGKANSAAIIITMAEPNPVCTVTARIPSVERFPATVEGLSRALQSKPIQQNGNEFTWRRGRTLVQLAATGTREKPAIRTVVMAMREEKK